MEKNSRLFFANLFFTHYCFRNEGTKHNSTCSFILISSASVQTNLHKDNIILFWSGQLDQNLQNGLWHSCNIFKYYVWLQSCAQLHSLASLDMLSRTTRYVRFWAPWLDRMIWTYDLVIMGLCINGKDGNSCMGETTLARIKGTTKQ